MALRAELTMNRERIFFSVFGRLRGREHLERRVWYDPNGSSILELNMKVHTRI